MVFVVSVHTLAFAGGTVTMSIGAVTTVFHTSRELFLLLTALVLTYNYGHATARAAGSGGAGSGSCCPPTSPGPRSTTRRTVRPGAVPVGVPA